MAQRSQKKPRAVLPAPPAPRPEPERAAPHGARAAAWPLWGGALLLVAATFAVYWPSLYGDYLWDDSRYLTANPHVRDPAGLWTIWFQPLDLVRTHYYPLALSSFWLEFHTWGLWPLGHHLINTTLHAATAVIAWLVMRRLEVPGAFIAAAVFALHPLQAESVAWISERKNVLCGVFYAIAFLAWLRFAESGRWRDYALSFAGFLLAIFSKTIASTFPLGVLVLAWWKEPKSWWRRIPSLLPFVAVSLILGLLGSWREEEFRNEGGWPEGSAFPLLTRVLIVGRAFWFYPEKIVWPAELMTIYPRWPLDDAWAYVGLAAMAAVVLGLWLLRQRIGRGPLAAVVYYGVTVGPAMGLVTTTMSNMIFVADHYQYLGGISLMALVCAAAAVALARWVPASAAVGAGVSVAVCAVFGTLTWSQAAVYQSRETLWKDTVEKNPTMWMAYYDLGTYYAERGRIDEAYKYLSEAVRLQPRYSTAHHNLGMVLAQMGRVGEGIAHLEEATRLHPGWSQARSNLGALYSQIGQYEKAADAFAKALEIRPGYTDARANLGVALRRLGRPEEAIPHLEQALRENPDHGPARENLKRALAARDGAPAP
jgi:tetratricopeptide (TPR) repeat protein